MTIVNYVFVWYLVVSLLVAAIWMVFLAVYWIRLLCIVGVGIEEYWWVFFCYFRSGCVKNMVIVGVDFFAS
ncbi:MAG: hypothetical protein O7C59_06450 [Rickettsia endosymbiont of Ixodes persulcatus]|nr:hypothetical protein [Rickettsia endosymbiont of Ixodes persulcatus]